MAIQNIKTLDTERLAAKTGNLYESVVVVSRRARQVATRTKAELDQKLSYFDDLTLLEPTEDLRVNEDQLKVSLEYERKPKSGAVAVQEFLEEEIYYRNSGSEHPTEL